MQRGDVLAARTPRRPGTWCSARCCSPSAASALLVRRNPLVMFMCVELMLNAVEPHVRRLRRALNDIAGQTVVFFVLVVAAAEVVVGLGIIVAILRRKPGATADDISMMKG